VGEINHDAYQTAQKEMIYEPGTIECRIFISTKEKLMDIHAELAAIEKAAPIQEKLREIYLEIEHMHAAVK
jgi:hypothetical protein